jgi:Cornifin (SPRR) family
MGESSLVMPVLGENGFLPVNSTFPNIKAKGIVQIAVCMTRGFSISFLDYYDCGGAPTPSQPSAPTPSGPTVPTPSMPSAPSPSGPTVPSPLTPSAPTPSGPTVPTPSTPSAPTPSGPAVPTPSTPSAPTPSGPTVPTPSTPSAPTPSQPSAPTPSSCQIIECDFDTLLAGVSLNNPDQAERLRNDCLVSVSASRTIDPPNNPVNVFDSTNIKSTRARHDPDLGAPNRECPGGGPGFGTGGTPDAAFPNCEPQGNLLIIQNEKMDPSTPNDSPHGGCLVFDFMQPMNLINFALLDIDEQSSANITITNSNQLELPIIFTPPGIGDNGFWAANTTQALNSFVDIKQMIVCFPGSGALSFIHFSTCSNGATPFAPTVTTSGLPMAPAPTTVRRRRRKRDP